MLDFSLREFTNPELKFYKVLREGEFDRKIGESENLERSLEMIIYKKDLTKLAPNLTDGGRLLGMLSGHSFIKDDLQDDDIIYFQDKRYRVTALLNRVYADFTDFELELMQE